MKLKLFLVAFFVLPLAGLYLGGFSQVAALAPIPAGCPGSPQAGPPAIDCSKIPLGCPGTTKQGPVAKAPTNCQYADPAAASSSTPSSTSGLTGCGTNADTKSQTGVNCVPNASDPVAKQAIGITANSPLVDKYLNPLIKLLSVLVGVAVTFGVIFGGIEYSMSAGDPQKASNGRKHIRNAVLALVAYALTLAFLNFIIPGGIAHP